MLLDIYGIKIEDDVPIFVKLINDFKNLGYDAYKIINEYTSELSLRGEVIVKQANVQNLRIQNAALNKTNSHSETQVNMHRQTPYALSKLQAMAFGLKEQTIVANGLRNSQR